jgi:hypothetical protein
VGYSSGVALLLAASFVPWAEMLFPVWVLLVSIRILRAGRAALSG